MLVGVVELLPGHASVAHQVVGLHGKLVLIFDQGKVSYFVHFFSERLVVLVDESVHNDGVVLLNLIDVHFLLEVKRHLWVLLIEMPLNVGFNIVVILQNVWSLEN